MKGASRGLHLAALALAAGCADECKVGDSCSKDCDPGQAAICVASGICSCKTVGDGGVGNEFGVTPDIPGCPRAIAGEVIINEIMIDGEAPDEENEYVELVNVTERNVGLNGLVLVSTKGETFATRVIFESACLPPRGAVAIYQDPGRWVWDPEPIAPPSVETKAFSFNNSADFVFRLETEGGEEIDQIAGLGSLIEEEHSQNRSPDGQPGGLLALHREVSTNGLLKSPARCANGGTFAALCGDPVDPESDGGVVDLDDGVPPPVCREPALGEIIINELMIDGETPEEDNEFVELVNVTGDALSLAGLLLQSNRGEAQAERVRFERGCLPANGAVAIFADPDLWIWEPVPAAPPVVDVSAFGFNNSDPFLFELVTEDSLLMDSASGAPDLIEDGDSANRSPDGVKNGDFALHTTLSPMGAGKSPARCANSGTFAAGCRDGVGPRPDGDVLPAEDAGTPADVGVVPPPCDEAAPGDLIINEVLIDGVEEGEQDEFVELVNVALAARSLQGLVITSNRGAGRASRVTFQGGCLASKGALGLFNDFGRWIMIPPPEPAVVAEIGQFAFANSVDFDFRLERVAGGEVLDTAAGPQSVIAEGVSQNRNPDLVGVDFIEHDTLSGTNSSPGLCSNGNTFLSDCQDPPPP